ncbi:DNA polymerase III subunit delta [Neptunicella marina]|uniref:DNA polymerase III subunit delta n=1 Tax=Neptunicella marina TaxID=2125989 RepID=A0A8J6IKR8_9ALTE|nr:DNA polymerase III subunit delta [Neptunicella marina]MBC3764560.1 DNA polymerase III subunit delta [Neptunicella marina]
MQVYPNRFAAGLQGQLKPFYLIFGEEPQQKIECIELIRKAAREQGFDERQSLVADSSFQWSSLIEASQSMSLFASRQIIELELPTGKPGTEGSKTLVSLTENPNPDTLFIIHGDKIGRDVQNSKWFKALDKLGVYVPCYPVEGRQLTQWIANRIQNKGLQATNEAINLLTEHCEGNLLAAQQEIDKLPLLFPDGKIDFAQLQQAMGDHSRFNVFQLVDVLLAGDIQKAIKMLYRLESEGIEPVVVLWALNREWQNLYEMKFATDNGQSLNTVFTQLRIWKNKQAGYQNALRRLSMAQLTEMQTKIAALDAGLKQSAIARPFIELSHICLLFVPVSLSAIELDYQ